MENKIMDLFSGTKKVQNKGMKYSVLLERLIAPFEKEFLDFEALDDIFDFAMIAWNIANIKLIIPKEAFEEAVQGIVRQLEDSALMHRMVDYKLAKFKEYTNFILNVELVETKGDRVLNVTTQEAHVYLAHMTAIREEEATQNDLE